MKLSWHRPGSAPRRGRSDNPPRVIEALESRQLLSADIQAISAAYFHEPTVLSGPSVTFRSAAYLTFGAGHVDRATIDWGDGSAASAGSISAVTLAPGQGQAGYPASAGVIDGDHAFAEPGTYDVSTTIVEHVAGGADVTDQAHLVVTVVAPSLTVSPGPGLTEADGTAFDGDVLASGVTDADLAPDHLPLSATIDWGDGSAPSVATIWPQDLARPLFVVYDSQDPLGFGSSLFPENPSFSGGFDVAGGHTYAVPGTYTAKVTVDRGGFGLTATTTTTIDVVSGTLHVASTSATAIAGVAQTDLDVGRLDDFTGQMIPTLLGQTQYTAVIDWGDGSAPSAGRVEFPSIYFAPVFGHSVFQVEGDHTYAHPGTYAPRVTVTDSTGRITTTTSAVSVSSLAVTLSPPDTFHTMANTDFDAYGHTLAHGTIGADVPLSDLKATVDWGDGSAPESGYLYLDKNLGDSGSLGLTISPGDPLSFVVSGSHVYAKAGTYDVHVTVTSPDGVRTSTDSSTTVVDFHAYGLPLDGPAGQTLGRSDLAVIGLPGIDLDPKRFTATIDWGDGSAPEAGTLFATTITTPPWFSPTDPARVDAVVAGSHAYAKAQIYAISVTITDALTGQVFGVYSYAYVDLGDDTSGQSGQPPRYAALSSAPLIPLSSPAVAPTTPAPSEVSLGGTTSQVPSSPALAFRPSKEAGGGHRNHRAKAHHPLSRSVPKALAEARRPHPHGPRSA